MKEKMKAFFAKIKLPGFLKKRPLYVVFTVLFSLIIVFDILIGLLVPSNIMAGGMAVQSGVTFDADTSDLSDIDITDESLSFDLDTSDLPDGSSFSGGAAVSPGNTDLYDASDSGAVLSEDADSSDTDADASADTSDADEDADTDTDTDTDADTDADADADTDFDADSAFSAAFPDGDDTSGGMTGSVPGAMGDSGDLDASAGTSDTTDETALADEEEAADAEVTQTAQSSSIGIFGFLYAVKSHWVLILVIFGILDAASIAMLVYLTILKRRERAQAAIEVQDDGEVHLVRPKKKERSSPWVWAIPVVGIVLLVVIVQMITSSGTSEAAQTEATVYSAEASISDISTVLPGTGTLEEEDAVELSLPSDVEITEWYVSNGDTVEVGDTLAKVDKISVMSAIASVQESLDAIDEEIAACEDTDTEQTITASASGRVKVIYAQEEADVIETMYESGALMLLSLDGLMAVDIETTAELTVGDEVTVILSDGTSETGTVESYINGTAVITLTDDGPSYGDSVSVYTEDGTLIGSGELYIHAELSVTAFSGTIDSISVEVEDEVSSGDDLIELTDVDNTIQMQLLVAQRSELEEQIQTLFTLYQEGYVYADTAGVVSGLTATSSSSSDDDDDTDDASDDADDTSDASDDDSTDVSDVGSGDSFISVSAQASASSGARLISLTYTTASASASSSYGIIVVSDEEDAEDDETDTSSEDDETADAEDAQTADEAQTTDGTAEEAGSGQASDEDEGYADYIGIVTAIDEETGIVTLSLLPGTCEIDDYSDLSSMDLSEESMTQSAQMDLSSAAIVLTYQNSTWKILRSSSVAAGDMLIIMCDETGTADESGTLILSPVCIVSITEEMLEADSADDSDTSTDGTDTDASGFGSGTGSDQSGTDEETSDSSDSSSSLEDIMNSLMSSTEDSDDQSSTDSTDYSSLLSAAASADTSSMTEAEASVTETLTEEISADYSVSETTWLSVTPQDTMYVTITVDELDILSIEVGQEAEVTLDAIPGQSFTGVVESINTTGTNSGGNSKYTAVISIARGESMLAGMNASVKITISTEEDVLCIPVDALVEDETGTYVYTSYDEKNDELGDLVEVTTGVSDGEYVEILSGLSEGDTYWYSILDVVNYSSSYS